MKYCKQNPFHIYIFSTWISSSWGFFTFFQINLQYYNVQYFLVTNCVSEKGNNNISVFRLPRMGPDRWMIRAQSHIPITDGDLYSQLYLLNSCWFFRTSFLVFLTEYSIAKLHVDVTVFLSKTCHIVQM